MALMQPVASYSILEHEDWFTWGGTVANSCDKRYHMVYSRWPKQYPFSDGWLIDSELCYAVADSATGPFKHVATILRGRKVEGQEHAWDGGSVHNPHLRHYDGKYYLYYTGTHDPYTLGSSKNRDVLVRHQRIGVIVFDSFNDLLTGQFKRPDEPLLKPLTNYGYNVPESEQFGEKNHISVANIVTVNPSVARRPDGKYILAFKSWQNIPHFAPIHGVAIADSPVGPFEIQPNPILVVNDAEGNVAMAEDPFIWFNQSRQAFYALVRDFKGSITGHGHSMALFQSEDGINWKPAKNVLASDHQIKWQDGRVTKVARLERPQLLLDEKGEPLVLYCACAFDMPNKANGHSFNIHIPLNQTNSSD